MKDSPKLLYFYYNREYFKHNLMYILPPSDITFVSLQNPTPRKISGKKHSKGNKKRQLGVVIPAVPHSLGASMGKLLDLGVTKALSSQEKRE